MTGIYKIESPTGKVYIGQSYNLEKRFKLYQYINTNSPKSLINRSIVKHGFCNHKFSVAHELPFDVDKETITKYEQFYLDQYKETGHTMLNICQCAGSPKGIKRSREQVEKHSMIMKGRTTWMKGKKHTEESKRIIKEKRRLQTNVAGRPKGNIPWNKGKKMPDGFIKGRPCSDEAREKLRVYNLGKKLSPETISKRTATLQANLQIKPRKDWSEEAKKRQSERYLGKKKSAETLLKGRQTRLLKIS